METYNIKKTDNEQTLTNVDWAACRELPHSDDIEKAILGALMVDSSALYHAIDKLETEYFYNKHNQLILNAIQSLYNDSKAVDILTVTEKLGRTGVLELSGGMLYVSQLASEVISAAHIDTHIAILKEKYVRREAIRISEETIREACSDTCYPLDMLERTQEELAEVCECVSDVGVTALSRVLDEYYDGIAGKLRGLESGVLSGFEELDRMILGFQPGTLSVLAARPAIGRTSCALSIARNIAVDCKMPVAYFSLDKKRNDLVFRLISQESGVPLPKMLDWNSLDVDERKAIYGAMKELGETPLYLDDTSVNAVQIRSRCYNLFIRYGVQMVIVDCIQFVKTSANGNNRHDPESEVASVARQLRELARELRIPVLALSQFNRAVDFRKGGVPHLADLRGSEAIEEYADNVIGIYRPSYYGISKDKSGNDTDNLAILEVWKSQSGETGEIRLHFDKGSRRFSNNSEPAHDLPAV